MDAVLNVVEEQIDMLQHYVLVLLVVLHKLDQEDVGLLHHFEVRILVGHVLNLLLLDDLDGDVVGAQVPQQPLVLLVKDVVVGQDSLVLVVPLLVELGKIQELECSFVVFALCFLFLRLLFVSEVDHPVLPIHIQVCEGGDAVDEGTSGFEGFNFFHADPGLAILGVFLHLAEGF